MAKISKSRKHKATRASKKSARNTPRQKEGVMPLGDRVLLRPLSPEEMGKKSPSGIIIPETIDKEKPAQGEVVAVGAGKFDERGNRIPMTVKVGDRVIFSKYGYDEVKVEEKEYYVVSEANILAVLH